MGIVTQTQQGLKFIDSNFEIVHLDGTTSTTMLTVGKPAAGANSFDFNGEAYFKNASTRYLILNYEDSVNTIASTSGTGSGASIESLNIRGDNVRFYTGYGTNNVRGSLTLTLDNSNDATFTGNVISDYNKTIALNYAAGTFGDYYKGMSGVDFGDSTARGLHLFNFDNDTNLGINFWVGTYASKTFAGRIDSVGKWGIGKVPATWKLDVDSGNVYAASFDTSNNTGVVINGNNVTASQIIGFSNSAQTYNDLDIRANATAGSGVYIDGSESRVGIGTTSPGRKLTVTGDVSGDANNLLIVNENDTDGDSASIGFSMLSNDTYVKAGIFFKRTTTQGRGDLIFATNDEVNGNNVTLSNARMTIDRAGNVGIGVSPSAKLHVAGNSILANNTTIDPDSYANTVVAGAVADGSGWGLTTAIGGNAGTGHSWGLGSNGSAFYMGYQNGSAVNTLQSFLIAHTNRNVQLVPTSGYVSIGAATPKTYLDVYNDSDVWHLMVGGATKKLLVGGQAVSGDVVLQAGAASTVNNAAVTTAYNLTLQRDGGNVGIAHASPTSKLSIVGAGADNTYSGVIGIENSSSAKWGYISLTDDIDTASESSNYYLIGRGSSYADRHMSFHVPTAANYGSGAQPKIIFASTGSDTLFSVEASTGTAYHKGSVGIGTDSPQEKLHIFNSSSAWNQFANIRLSTESDSFAAEVGFHRGTTDNTNRGLFLSGDGTNKHLHVGYTGLVGIGTDTPETKLHVEGTIQLGNEEDLAWAYDNGNYYNYITNFYNSADGLVYRSGGWTGNQTYVAHSFETWTGSAWDKKLTIKQNGDATFAGNVTAGDSSTAVTIRAHHDDGAYVDHTGYGIQFARNASYLRPNNDGARTMYFGQSSLTWNAIVFDSNSYTFQKDGNTLLEVDSFGQVNFKGYNGADGFTLPNVTEDTGYSNISMGGVGFLYRGARDSYITQNTYYSKISGSNGWRAKYGGHGGTVITLDHGFTVSTAAAVTNSGDTFSMGTVFDVNESGDGLFTGSLETEGPDGGLVLRSWQAGASYGMLGTANMANSEYAVLTDGTHTYISGGAGGNVSIRAGNNDSTHQLAISSTSATFNGDVTFDYGHIGAGNSSYAMPIGFNRNTATGAIFNSSYSAYQLHSYLGNLKLQVYNSAGVYQGQHAFNSDLSFDLSGRLSPDTPNDYKETAITSLIEAPIYYPETNVGTTASYVPHTHARTRYNSGYRNHTSTGVYASASGWNYSYYIAMGGNDSYPTDAIYFDVYNNAISHSDGHVGFSQAVHATNFVDRDATSYSLTPDSTATGQWQVNTPSGNVRIGPGNTTYSHFSTDRSRFYFNKKLVVDEGIISSYNEDLRLRRTESNNDSILITDTDISFILDGAEDMRLQNDGDLHVEGDVIAYSTTVSDNRLKDDVVTIDSALDKVSKLRGVEYTWNNTSRKGQKDIGVIAQEVEEVIPEIVREKEMSLMDGKKYKTVDYEKLTAVLIEAVKELKEEVEELKNKCNDCTK